MALWLLLDLEWEVITLAHLDRRMYILGYLAREGRVFLVDKAGSVVSYGLCLAVLEYQTVVVRRDFVSANRILADVPCTRTIGTESVRGPSSRRWTMR